MATLNGEGAGTSLSDGDHTPKYVANQHHHCKQDRCDGILGAALLEREGLVHRELELNLVTANIQMCAVCPDPPNMQMSFACSFRLSSAIEAEYL